MSEIIEKYYIKYKYPNLQRLYDYMKEDNISVTRKQIKEFLESQVSKQVTQTKKVFKSENGHIVAFNINELWQIDIFYLPKYYKSNRGYKYIFCCIDVFSRYVYCIPLKYKDNSDVVGAMRAILKMNSPIKIISDSDSVFNSNEFQKLLYEYDIIHETVPINDHASLGVIDRFARTLKQRITDLFLGNDNTNWIDDFDDIINEYNNTKNRGILKIKPSKVYLPENIALLVNYNKLKMLKNNIISDLKIGDKVRIFIKKSMDKGTEPQFSNDIYTVEHIKGKTITLNNGIEKRRNDLLLIPADTKEIINKKNIIRLETQNFKNEQSHKRDDILETNKIYSKRERKQTEFYSPK